MARVRNVEWDTKIKLLATVLSGGAALASILSFVAGRRSAHDSATAAGLAAAEVTRIALSPATDTAYSLGDTLHFTTVAADAHGQVLHAASVHWTVDNPTVAAVDSAGQVVALAPGETTVTVAIGGRAGRARIWVQPRMIELAIIGDSIIPIAEGTALELRAMGSDARGNWLDPADAVWSGGDAEIAVIDTAGNLRAVAPGMTTISVAAAGLAAERQILVTPVPTSLTLMGGATQRAAAGQKVPEAVTVQVVSRSGRPVPNARVRFDPSADMGGVDPEYRTTDSLGLAATHWTLGPTPGRQHLAIVVTGIDSAMTVIAEADPIPGRTRIAVSPDTFLAEVGTALPEPLVVQVTDTSGVVLTDLPVTWTALDGGSIIQTNVRTDSMGMVQAHWLLGPRAGRQRARVQVGNPRSLPPLEVSAAAEAGTAVAVEVVSGNSQSGSVGSALKRAVTMRAVDSLGNPVSGVPIRLSAKAGATDSLVETGEDGRASVRWTLGESAGSARLVARLTPKGDSAVVTATARAGSSKTIKFVGAPSSGTAGRAISKTIRIVVTDRFGNPVPKATVRFSVHAGKASPSQGVTDSAGRLSTKWTLGPKAGKQSLTATIKNPAVKSYHVIVAKAPPAPSSPASTKRRTTKK